MALKAKIGAARRQPLVNARSIELLTKSWSYLFLFGLVVFFSVTGTGFFSIRNFANILTTSTLIMLMSIGQTYVIITAGIDLSIGWTVGLSSVTTARVMRDLAASGNDIEFAMLMGVLAGLFVAIIPGLVNGCAGRSYQSPALYRHPGYVWHCAWRRLPAHGRAAGRAWFVLRIARGSAFNRQR